MSHNSWLKKIGIQENETLEYKTVLPTSKNIAQIICSFANTEGGLLVLGVSDASGIIEFIGLSNEFNAISITHKAIDRFSVKPEVEFGYVNFEDKTLFVIDVSKSNEAIYLDGLMYRRNGTQTIVEEKKGLSINVKILHEDLHNFNTIIISAGKTGTNSKIAFVNHYKSVLQIINNSQLLLFKESFNEPTKNKEGKILTRILYSSCVDTFEVYLSELLYEIYISSPSSLKSNQTVTVEEVLNCSDMEDFIRFVANKKISKLQRGSVKGFIKDNKQIRDLNVFSNDDIDLIDKYLQIRHLFTHKNGIIDEKFLTFFNSSYNLKSEFLMSMNEMIDRLTFLIEFVNRIDLASKEKYNISYISNL